MSEAAVKTKIASRSHPGSFAWLIAQPRPADELYTITSAADLPALRIRSGDVIKIKPQRKYTHCNRYLFSSGEIAAVGFGPCRDTLHVLWQDGRREVLRKADANSRIVGWVEGVSSEADNPRAPLDGLEKSM